MARSATVAPGGAAWQGVAAPTRYLTAVSGDDRHFVDQYGDPYLMLAQCAWTGVAWAGYNNGDDWAGDITWWCDQHAANGGNAAKVGVLGHTDYQAPYDNANTHDGVSPWSGGTVGSLNETYWTRVDWWVTETKRNGLTLIIYLGYEGDLSVLSSATSTQLNNYGYNVATRYAGEPHVLFAIGGDYFGYLDSTVNAVLTGVVTQAGYDKPLWIQYYPESTGRRNSSDSITDFDEGWSWATADHIYTYNCSYLFGEMGWTETPARPCLWGDGIFDNGAADRRLMRETFAWAVTSGLYGGMIYGNEGTFQMGNTQTGWRTTMSSANGDMGDIPTVRDIIAGYADWQTLVPDHSDSFITAGRGTKATHYAPGGGNGEYAGGNTYVTGGVNAAGTLAIIYVPNAATTVTLDTTQMQGGYTATWVDPTDGSTVAGTPGTTFQRATSNTAGDSDWLLVLEA